MTANLYIGGVFQSDKGIIGGNLKIAKERASNEMYYRTKVSGSITFLKDDYQALYDMDLDTRCEVQLIEGGLIASATFFKTDCEFDVDNRICTLKPKFVDNYEKLIQGIDNKENITRIGCPISAVEGKKRGILQFYMYGERKITNIVGNMSYEVDAEETRDLAKLTKNPDNQGYGFMVCQMHFSMDVKMDSGQAYKSEIDGRYIGELTYQGLDSQGKERWEGRLTNEATGTYFNYRLIENVIIVYTTLYRSNGTLFGTTNEHICITYGNTEEWTAGIARVRFDSEGHPDLTTAVGEADPTGRISLCRILADRANIAGGAFYERSLDDDICTSNYNYRYVGMTDNVRNTLPYRVIQSFEVQDDPTEWGMNSEGKYFVKPSAPSGYNNPRVVPFARSLWIPGSYWLVSDIYLASNTDLCNETFFCRDAFSIADVLRKLVGKVDDRILGVQSEFLEPVQDHPMFPITFSRFTRWWITPITNIKKTYYEQAAQRGDISIQDILKMLRALGLYWHLENTRYGYVMRIEHYLWYRNGGSYGSDTRTPIISLGNVTSPKLGKPWSFGQNKVTWDLDKPKRLEFAWQSECTEEFNGYPLEIKNAYMEKGSKDTISAGVFVSDIDLVIASPSEVGDDCFALFMTNRVANQNVIPLVDANIPGATPLVRMQNGYLSYLWIEQNLLKYGLGGNRYSIENAEFTENKTARMRKQDVVFPIGWDSLQEYGLIETPMGKGEMIKVEWDVESHKASATIKLDNE